ncbi:MAG: hypothetical protein AAGE94_07725, partial [Acidobacteriota bacterium]
MTLRVPSSFHRVVRLVLVGLVASFLAPTLVIAAQPPLRHALVYVQYPSPENLQQPVLGNLFRLDPNGATTNLTRRSDAAVRDPEISWDGTRVVFSMQIGSDTASWQVWEIGVSTDLAQTRAVDAD